MGLIHTRILKWLGYDVTTVDPDPSKGADCLSMSGPNLSQHVAAVVAVPIAHAADTASWFEGFAGHLLLEKPLARDSREAAALIEALEGVNVGVGYVERFNPVARHMKATLGHPTRVLFERWNNRPSWDVQLDLASHDHDLARWLGVESIAEYSTLASAGCRVRTVTAEYASGRSESWDLMQHDANPLCAQWHSFLMNRNEIATMQDAAAAIASLEKRGTVPGQGLRST